MHLNSKILKPFILTAIFFTIISPSKAFAQYDLSDKAADRNIVKMQKYLLSKVSADGIVGSTSYRQQKKGALALAAYSLIDSGVSKDNSKVAKILAILKNSKSETAYSSAMKIKLYCLLGKDYYTSMLKEIRWLVDQQKSNGGWSNHSNQSANIVETAHVLEALFQASQIGYPISKNIWNKALEFVDSTDNGESQHGYQPVKQKRRFKGDSCGYFNAAASVCYSRIIAAKMRTGKYDSEILELWKKCKLAFKHIESTERLVNSYSRKIGAINGWIWGDSPTYSCFDMVTQASDFISPMYFNQRRLDSEIRSLIAKKLSKRGSLAGNTEEDRFVATAYGLILQTKTLRPIAFTVIGHEDNSPIRGVMMQNICEYLTRKFGKKCTWRTFNNVASKAGNFTLAPIVIDCVGKRTKVNKNTSAIVKKCINNNVLAVFIPLSDAKQINSKIKKAISNLRVGKFATLSKDAELFNYPIIIKPMLAELAESNDKKVYILNSKVAKQLRTGCTRSTLDSYDLFVNLVASANTKYWSKEKITKKDPNKQPNNPNTPIFKKVKLPEPIASFDIVQISRNKKTCNEFLAALNKSLLQSLTIGLNTKVRSKLGNLSKFSPDTLVWEVVSKKSALLSKPLELKKFLEAGGSAIIECENNGKLIKRIYKKLEKIAGKSAIKYLSVNSDLITGNFLPGVACDIVKLKFNPAQAKRAKSKTGVPLLVAIMIKGRPALFLSPNAITASATGKIKSKRSKVLGYSPESANKLAFNLILFANKDRKKRKNSL